MEVAVLYSLQEKGVPGSVGPGAQALDPRTPKRTKLAILFPQGDWWKCGGHRKTRAFLPLGTLRVVQIGASSPVPGSIWTSVDEEAPVQYSHGALGSGDLAASIFFFLLDFHKEGARPREQRPHRTNSSY